jgi:hypothetical protein
MAITQTTPQDAEVLAGIVREAFREAADRFALTGFITGYVVTQRIRSRMRSFIHVSLILPNVRLFCSIDSRPSRLSG